MSKRNLTWDTSPETLKVSEASRLAGLHVNTIRAAINGGRLPATKPTGSHWRIQKVDLLTYIGITKGVGVPMCPYMIHLNKPNKGKPMNLKDYQAWAITKKNDDLTEREAKLTWALGLADETIEVWHQFHYGFESPLEMLDELGDVTWYAAVLADAYHIPLETVGLKVMTLGASVVQTSHMETVAKVIGEMVKKNISHGHRMPIDDLRMNLGHLLGAVGQMSNGLSRVGSGLAEVLQLNYDKLEHRYYGGFSSAASERRYKRTTNGEE